MIKTEQIPDEVVRALKQCLNGCDCDECLAVCIAAALNAWPGMEIETVFVEENYLILPLPKENTND